MNRGFPKIGGSALALVLGVIIATEATAAGQGITRGISPPTTAPATAPVINPAPVRPSTPVAPPAGKPDYAISLASQQELENTAMQWRFRVDNKGSAAPTGKSDTIPGYGGVSIKLPGATAARLVVSVGKPCPNSSNWTPYAETAIGVLGPGSSAVVPLTPVQMPADSVGKGCRFRAEIVGPVGDANPANNVMHMITKTALLPDLVVEFGPDLGGGPGGNLDVRNRGTASAGPSSFHYECTSQNKEKSCGKPSEPWKGSLTSDVPVPALNPGQSHMVKGSTPKGAGVSWKATADHAKQVTEADEGNNMKTSGK